MPLVRLVEGDLQILWEKLTNMEEMMSMILAENQKQFKDMLLNITADLAYLKSRPTVIGISQVVTRPNFGLSLSCATAPVVSVSGAASVGEESRSAELAYGINQPSEANHWDLVRSSGPPTESESEIEALHSMKTLIS